MLKNVNVGSLCFVLNFWEKMQQNGLDYLALVRTGWVITSEQIANYIILAHRVWRHSFNVNVVSTHDLTSQMGKKSKKKQRWLCNVN